MADLPAVFINWTNPDWIVWLDQELKQGRVRQGWGGPNCHLLDDNNQLRDYSAWQSDYLAFMQAGGAKPSEITDSKTATRFSILRTLLEIKPGDIILYPRVPNEQFFTTVQASGTYTWNDSHFPSAGESVPWGRPGRDAGHMIPIDPRSARYHERGKSELATLISQDFPYHRRAVNAVRDIDDADLIRRIHLGSL